MLLCHCNPVLGFNPKTNCTAASIRGFVRPIYSLRPIDRSNPVVFLDRPVGQATSALAISHNSWLNIIWIDNLDIVNDAVPNRTPKAGRRNTGSLQHPLGPRNNFSYYLGLSFGEVDSRIKLIDTDTWWD